MYAYVYLCMYVNKAIWKHLVVDEFLLYEYILLCNTYR
jgi:hypothetical protein